MFVKVQTLKFEYFVVIIIGRTSAISTSKIKKIIAIKKNRIEKGSREELKGLKPHSKGDVFSCSKYVFFLKAEESVMTIIAIIKILNPIIIKLKIIYIKLNLIFVIGSYIYFIYYTNYFVSLLINRW